MARPTFNYEFNFEDFIRSTPTRFIMEWGADVMQLLGMHAVVSLFFRCRENKQVVRTTDCLTECEGGDAVLDSALSGNLTLELSLKIC